MKAKPCIVSQFTFKKSTENTAFSVLFCIKLSCFCKICTYFKNKCKYIENLSYLRTIKETNSTCRN